LVGLGEVVALRVAQHRRLADREQRGTVNGPKPIPAGLPTEEELSAILRAIDDEPIDDLCIRLSRRIEEGQGPTMGELGLLIKLLYGTTCAPYFPACTPRPRCSRRRSRRLRFSASRGGSEGMDEHRILRAVGGALLGVAWFAALVGVAVLIWKL
jgi:hypothetical protein